MSESIEALLRHPGIWKPGEAGAPAKAALPSGYPALDGLLPWGGWPGGAVSEIHAAGEGIGELGLLVPALGKLSAAGRFIVFIEPPRVPYVPALAHRDVDVSRLLVVRAGNPGENLWAAEQALRTPACGAVVLWEGDGRFGARRLRRLQLAAEAGGGSGVVFRRPEAGAAPSPAALRLRLEADPPGLAVTLIKGRGGMAGKRITLGADHGPHRVSHAWPSSESPPAGDR